MYKSKNRAKSFYDWERILQNEFNYKVEALSVKDTKKYATYLWNKYKNKFFYNFDKRIYHISSIKFVDMTKHSGPASAWDGWVSTEKYTKKGCRIFKRKLRFPIWSQRKDIVIHEVAHLLAPRSEKHDQNFVGIYSMLLAIELKFDLQKIIKSANDNNIAISFLGSKYLQKLANKFTTINGKIGIDGGNVTPILPQQLVA